MGRLRYRIILKYIGGVIIIIGGAFSVTSLISLVLGEGTLFIFYLVLALACFLSGWYLFGRIPERDVTIYEGTAIASLSFLVASIISAVPFILVGGMSPVDGWFEAMSGFTTTGFTMMDVESSHPSLVFLRAISQWLGGMGFVVITVSLFLVSGRSAVLLLKEEAKGKLFPRIARHVQVVVITYGILSMVGFLMLLVSGLSIFDALCYTLSGISTGGFSPTGDVITPSMIPSMMVIMLLGAINLIVYYKHWSRKRNIPGTILEVVKEPQIVWLLSMILILTIAVGVTMTEKNSWLDALFVAVSAQTTTGFYTVDVSGLSAVSLLLLVAGMFVGGSMGSTSGGIKVFRIMAFIRGIHRFVLTHHYPKEMVVPEREVAKEELLGICYVIGLYVMFIFGGTLIFVWHGLDPLRSLFDITSAVGTVGLSSGIVSPELAWDLKMVVIFLMWAGRLEFVPLVVWVYSFFLKETFL